MLSLRAKQLCYEKLMGGVQGAVVPMAGSWNKMIFEIPSNLNHSMIL